MGVAGGCLCSPPAPLCQHRQRPSAPDASLGLWRWSGNQSRRSLKAEDLLGRLLWLLALLHFRLSSPKTGAEVPVLPPGSPQELEPAKPGAGWAREAPSALPGLLQTIPRGSSGTGIGAAVPRVWDLLALAVAVSSRPWCHMSLIARGRALCCCLPQDLRKSFCFLWLGKAFPLLPRSSEQGVQSCSGLCWQRGAGGAFGSPP